MADAIIATIDAVRSRASTQETILCLAVPKEYSHLVSNFLSRIGTQVGVAFADVSGPQTEKLYGEQAKQLWQSSFFRTPAVWEKIGTDEEFLAWIRKQRSAKSNQFSEYVHGEGRCEAAHVRRINLGAGTGKKPPYAAIPLTREEHRIQTNTGEAALLMPNEWWETMRIKYVQEWSWVTLRKKLGFNSWSEIEPGILRSWANTNDLAEHLPAAYRSSI